MLDYYIVTSLSAKSSEAQHFRTFYYERGQCTRPSTDSKTGETGGRRFLRCWTGGLFQEVASKRKGRLSFGSSTDAQPSAVSADDL